MGKGEIIKPKERCKGCSGRKVVRERTILEVCVDKGMVDGQKIVFTGDEPLSLAMGKEDGPLSALAVRDQSAQKLESEPGRLWEGVIKGGDVKMVYVEGMPEYKNPFEKGKLVVEFVVRFPVTGFISVEDIGRLEALLPPRKVVVVPEDAEEVVLVEMDSGEKSGTKQSGVKKRRICQFKYVRLKDLEMLSWTYNKQIAYLKKDTKFHESPSSSHDAFAALWNQIFRAELCDDKCVANIQPWFRLQARNSGAKVCTQVEKTMKKTVVAATS
uniref:Chaperone DnaJ C-terminal domain-containing protein n=1 Tax=Strigamia maritima TaxID=126957 RepID=T1IKX8_STRMM